jgi:hypothetical protein
MARETVESELSPVPARGGSPRRVESLENIAQIYGLEKGDGTRALVLELVEGPTLADRIEEAPIPIDDALPIAG